MESSLVHEIESQITCLQQLTRITERFKEKCIRLEAEKKEALEKCEDMKIKLERLSNKTCTKCSFLKSELRKEREEKEKLKKAEKAKLLKTIARTLASLDDGNTNHVNQLLTELNFESPEPIERGIKIIEDREDSEEEDGSRILVNETVIVDEERKESDALKREVIEIPETEVVECSPQKTNPKRVLRPCILPKVNNRNSTHSKENTVAPDDKEVIEQANKKMRMSPILSSENISPLRDKVRDNISSHSPSVLSEIIQVAGGSASSSIGQDEKGAAWKMKPSVMVEAVSTSAPGGKKLKQMTLSLTKAEKKHDVSLSDNFRGGVARNSDDDDVVQPSPEPNTRKLFVKKASVCPSLEDPDLTVFNPVITSTCVPAPGETSFDRLPEIQKSPKYKYRRETVRKRCERLQLPGQDCDQCAKYYEAAGEDQEVRARLNQCSRHRDKYQLRANTPPGFWDPVLPMSPEDR